MKGVLPHVKAGSHPFVFTFGTCGGAHLKLRLKRGLRASGTGYEKAPAENTGVSRAKAFDIPL